VKTKSWEGTPFQGSEHELRAGGMVRSGLFDGNCGGSGMLGAPVLGQFAVSFPLRILSRFL
jgi:hypothetical protein